MKYIIKLEKVVEKTVVLEASSDEEADKKLLEEKVLFSKERIVNTDCYNGWKYLAGELIKVENDAVICNIEDFASWFGCDNSSHLERALFKNTNCGMCYSSTEDYIELAGYVEGVDCGGPSEKLYYPFTGETACSAIKRLNKEAEIMWREWNDKDADESNL